MTSADPILQQEADRVMFYFNAGWTLEDARQHVWETSTLGLASWVRIDAIVEAELQSAGQV